MSSCTSSSEPGAQPERPEGSAWRRFNRFFAWTGGGLLLLLYGFVLLVDPWETLPFSLPMDRVPAGSNMRYAFPMLARRQAFDSAVFGTSSSRLWSSSLLNELFDARFAQLSLDGGRPQESEMLHRIFVDHHPSPEFVIYEVGMPYFAEDLAANSQTNSDWPDWLYDDNYFNDFGAHFGTHALTSAFDQVYVQLGITTPRRGRDGYGSFLPPDGDYRVETARRLKLRRWGRQPPFVPVEPAVSMSAAEKRALRLPGVGVLHRMLRTLPDETRKIVVFPPYHASELPWPGTLGHLRWEEGKRRIAEVGDDVLDLWVLDFAFYSPLTLEDANWWDGTHSRIGVARDVVRAIHAAWQDGRDTDVCRVLRGP